MEKKILTNTGENIKEFNMSLLQEYQNWLNIKDDVYFVIDNTILKYGLKLGYSDNDIKQEILKNSPQLKNMPKEYTIKYLSKLQGNNLNQKIPQYLMILLTIKKLVILFQRQFI